MSSHEEVERDEFYSNQRQALSRKILSKYLKGVCKAKVGIDIAKDKNWLSKDLMK